MKVTKLNVGMLRAEKKRIAKQQQIAAQEARLQKCITKTAQKVFTEITPKTSIYKANSIPSITDYLGKLKGTLSATESEWAPWSKLYR